MNGGNEIEYFEGTFEARYLAFLETISTLRPSLHRYCARMIGSVMDGEDVCRKLCSKPTGSWTSSIRVDS